MIVLALAVASPALAEKIDRHFHQTFDVQEGAKLILRHGDGEVSISPWENSSIRTSDGDVTLERCEGSLQVEASDGRLTLSRIRGDRLDLRTSDGDVELDLMASETLDLTIRSGDGHVAVDLDPALSVAFTIQTGDGDVRMSGIEVAGLRKERRHTSGRIGDGRGAMSISTGDGDVVLRQNYPAACLAARCDVESTNAKGSGFALR
jgi:DUF4097 and DUF4098 domain-containing protein YvlB